MASRTKQKEEARARRLAEEQERVERERRTRRLQMLLGVAVAAVAVVAVAIAISVGGSSSSPSTNSASAKRTAGTVSSMLAGIPQSGSTIGNPNAKVTVTEWGDLQCPICRDFALGAENNLISSDVRSGKVKLTYRSLETATGNSPNPSIFPVQQAAALAAGNQRLAWNYILLFYHQQGAEGTNYVTSGYLNGLAKQIPALNFSKWSTDRSSSTFSAQVVADANEASGKGYNSTPTIVVQGPKGSAKPIVGDTDYGSLEQAINSVQ
ncbi:MAG: thioredoxin domain-containing protein [Solirubrobacterales bacterium]|nr:thioredoxin domain-containing protein [Solirubrobacterales bacterium]